MIPFFDKFSNSVKDFVKVVVGHGVLFSGLVIILLSTTSFFLGRMSTIFEERPVFSVTAVNTENYALDENLLEKYKNVSTSTIVASKKGKKYYFVWCKYANNIKPENRRYFDTEAAAQAAGLSLAANCK